MSNIEPGPVGPRTGLDPAHRPSTATGPRRVRRVALLPLIIAAAVGAALGGATVGLIKSQHHAPTNAAPVSRDPAPILTAPDGTVQAAARRILPSVVSVTTTVGKAAWTSSGVVIRSDGYIVTNDHAVSPTSGPAKIIVTLSDGRSAPAALIGRDRYDDLAVIRTAELQPLVPATFGRSDSLAVGQTVLATGSPTALPNTVLSATVSATGRPISASADDQAVIGGIQTDQSIDPEMAGGPLTDLDGVVIGIDVNLASSSTRGVRLPGRAASDRALADLGFAIPADLAGRIAAQLISSRRATHAVIGLSLSDESSTSGVQVTAVTARSGAQRAGLHAGDRILEVDGLPVTSAQSLLVLVRNHSPSDRVAVTYSRKSKTVSVRVALGSATN